MTVHAVFGQPLAPFALTNERITVRPWELVDLAAVEEASADEIIPMQTTVPPVFTKAEGEAFIHRQQTRLSSGEGWAMAIADNDLGRAIGHIGLWISDLHKGRAAIGYWVVASARGRAAAAEALSLITDWAFAELPVHRLHLFIEPWNTASIRTAEGAGYRAEAVLHHWEVVGGEPKDMWSYVRLRARD